MRHCLRRLRAAARVPLSQATDGQLSRSATRRLRPCSPPRPLLRRRSNNANAGTPPRCRRCFGFFVNCTYHINIIQSSSDTGAPAAPRLAGCVYSDAPLPRPPRTPPPCRACPPPPRRPKNKKKPKSKTHPKKELKSDPKELKSTTPRGCAICDPGTHYAPSRVSNYPAFFSSLGTIFSSLGPIFSSFGQF